MDFLQANLDMLVSPRRVTQVHLDFPPIEIRKYGHEGQAVIEVGQVSGGPVTFKLQHAPTSLGPWTDVPDLGFATVADGGVRTEMLPIVPDGLAGYLRAAAEWTGGGSAYVSLFLLAPRREGRNATQCFPCDPVEE